MKAIILSIKKQYSEAILSGIKKCELRRSPFPRDVDIVIIYSSNHVGLITGWFTIQSRIEGSPEEIWKQFSKEAYITKDEFDKYYEGATKGVCLVIDTFQRLEPPINPTTELREFVAPQSFMYPRDSDWVIFEERIPPLQNQTLDSHFGKLFDNG
ncbi:MAG: ASCH domain-containing protein [Thermoplasmatales archaeon]|nr:ASCH domain-containing protein [Thermoplasmatales archaeon]